eukprot:scaffold22261_cov72-Skeletonema_dohrnii-CCMP3373.AAC.2
MYICTGFSVESSPTCTYFWCPGGRVSYRIQVQCTYYLLERLGRREYWQPHTPTCIKSKVEQGVDGSGGTLIKPSARLLCFDILLQHLPRGYSYCIPIRKGLSSKKVESSSGTLLNIPRRARASLYLLEELGVVTALTLTLIDDELACDPFSTLFDKGG